MIKVLLTDKSHPILKERLAEAGFAYDEILDIPREEILNVLHLYDAVIVRSKILADQEFIDKGKRLKCIGRIGSGMEIIDIEYATQKGIACLNSPEGNRDAVAEHALGMLLCLLNHINTSHTEVQQGFWRREANRGVELCGKTVGIIGFGYMGEAFAKRLQSFGVRILAYDKYKKDYATNYVEEVDLTTIFSKADIISMHVPLTNETKGMVDRNFLQNFSKDIFFLNTSRGAVVKTVDLVEQLKNGKVRGACLDVLEYENMVTDALAMDKIPDEVKYLFQATNVILTPHIAGWTVESKYKLAEVLAQKIICQLRMGN